MILIAKRPTHPGGGWGYLGEEAGDEWEPAASAADTIPVLPAITGATGVAPAEVEARRSARAEYLTALAELLN